MDSITHIALSRKLLEACGCDIEASIYSVLPVIDEKPSYFKGVYCHILGNHPKVLDNALQIFTSDKINSKKKSYEYNRLVGQRESIFSVLDKSKEASSNEGSVKISDNKIDAALALISHSYFDCFMRPVQFFVPLSSSCSGQWSFWDKIDYLGFIEKCNEKENVFSFRERMVESSVWKLKMGLDDFPLIVKKRLLKEKAFGKKLNPENMIKAMIIRMGELASPSINYEIIDYSIRSFFTYLKVKKYLRIDREIFFLRELEKEIKEVLRNR